MIYKSQICLSLHKCTHILGGAPNSLCYLIAKTHSKTIYLVNNCNLTKSLKPLSLGCSVSDFYFSILQTPQWALFSGDQRYDQGSPETYKMYQVTSRAHPFQFSSLNSVNLLHNCCSIPGSCKLWNFLPLNSLLSA